MTVGAFFDMDKTLLSESSSLLWARYLWQRGELPVPELLRILGVWLRYKLNRLDMVEITRQLVGEMAGESEGERIAMTRRWFEEQLAGYVTDEGRRRVEAHRRLRHRVVLITASPSYIAHALADALGLPSGDVLATRLEVRDGRFTGRLIEPMCYGEGKVVAAMAYARARRLDLAASYFYTDSISDLPLLRQVGYPVAVNPDRPLLERAEREGWPVVRFY